MSISEQSITELKIILEQEFGRVVTQEEVADIGIWLIGYYGRLAKHDSQTNGAGLNGDRIKKHTT